MANDIHMNPGPHFQNNVFNFMNWNINLLAEGRFERVRVIEAHNTVFNYEVISICETTLNDSVEIPDPLVKRLFPGRICLLMNQLLFN